MALANKSIKNWLLILIILAIVIYAFSSLSFTLRFGTSDADNRPALLESSDPLADLFTTQVKPILDSRCVVCHACYDAPCQLKLTSVTGIERGAHKDSVYQGSRLTEAQLTRLDIDATTTSMWRELGFKPVLNERKQNADAHINASTLAQFLLLKKQHPLPQEAILDSSFDFSLDRSQQCPAPEEFNSFAKQQPLAGMPYGLPGISEDEHDILLSWLKQGAPMPKAAPLPKAEQKAVNELEAWLNNDSLKSQLTSRYIYEHLFTSNLYFNDLTKTATQPQFYRLVRSRTPPSTDIELIVTRRPFDDPKTKRVYYRLQAINETIVSKTHQPYAIDKTLLNKWQTWFFDAPYHVNQLPSYELDIAANPLIAFKQLPINARYRFMLERAENTIMGYIKGPVCRGQVALNVINDRFWVYFMQPDLVDEKALEAFYNSQQDNLRLPAEEDSSTLATGWQAYAKRQGSYIKAKSEFMQKSRSDGLYLTPNGLWDGDGNNQNASLTVFRHFDNATVVKGLVGTPPKTAWVIDYVLLERIHYLLVAGFDVYGNFGHQLMTRLYMDFLRMEGESNFLAFLPAQTRQKELRNWYQKSSPELVDFLENESNAFNLPSHIGFKTDDHKEELYQLFAKQLSHIQPSEYQQDKSKLTSNSKALMKELTRIKGKAAAVFPELTIIMVEPLHSSEPEIYTLIRNSAHFNVNSLFTEEENRDFNNDDLTLVQGLLGSYPDAFWHVKESQLAKVIAQAQDVKTQKQYQALLDNVAIRRSAPDFWAFSDKLNKTLMRKNPIDKAWLDYNRLENR